MSQLTPPSSHSGTPVKNSDLVERANDHSRRSAANGGPSSSSRIPVLDDSDVEYIKTDGSDEDMEEENEQDSDANDQIEMERPVQGRGGLTPAPSQDQIAKDEPLATPSKRGAKAGQTAKAGKGKKKDADLFESDVVARWNREIGDVCAPSPAT